MKIVGKVAEAARRRRRALQIAAAAGALGAIVCRFVPVEYQEACKAVAAATRIAVGGGCS